MCKTILKISVFEPWENVGIYQNQDPAIPLLNIYQNTLHCTIKILVKLCPQLLSP